MGFLSIMRRLFSLLLTAICVALTIGVTHASQRPKLVVNIIVGTMKASDLDRYADNFSMSGFRRLMNEGVCYTNAEYDYALTTSASGLATFATGAQPSVHGVIGKEWWNYLDGSRVELIADRKVVPVEYSTGTGSYSAHRLTAPTLGDMILTDSRCKQYTLAMDALSAIVLNGHRGVALWSESNKGHWVTSTAYLESLPIWLKQYNKEDSNSKYILKRWTPLYEAYRYHNDEVAIIEGIKNKSTKLISGVDLTLSKDMYGQMRYTPAGNTMLLELASLLMTIESIGKDEYTDIINVSLDPARYIAEVYGPESMEYEDMLYRLDQDLSKFITYIRTAIGGSEDVVITLSAGCGTSPSYDKIGEAERERLNIRQMEVIVNAYLGAHYGSAEYILGFANNALYLNHDLIKQKHLELDAIREEVAVFLLKHNGIANAISASSLRNTSFAEGRSRLMQQSFYPTRSGDVLIDLMPGCILDDNDYRSSSAGGYRYDRHVPLIICYSNTKQSVNRKVSITEVAPTIAHILNIETPWASNSEPLEEFNK